MYTLNTKKEWLFENTIIIIKNTYFTLERKSATFGAKVLPLLRDKRSHLSSFASLSDSFSSTKLVAFFP